MGGPRRSLISRQGIAHRLALAASLAAGLTATAAAQEGAGDAPGRYGDCLALVRSSPLQGFDAAETWREAAGALPARHCAAVALVELGRFRDAARRLEAIYRDMDRNRPRVRAGVLIQTGHAWALAGEPVRASAAFAAGLELEPENVELLIDRAAVLATQAKFWEAVDDLNRALELAPGRVDALVFRATYYRNLDAVELAGDDL